MFIQKKKSKQPIKKESKLDYIKPPKPEKTFQKNEVSASEIKSLQFLMTPRILYLSLKNQQSLPYIFYLTLMPKLIMPCSENYIFEWKNLNNSKTVL